MKLDKWISYITYSYIIITPAKTKIRCLPKSSENLDKIEKTMNLNLIGLLLAHDKLCNTIDFHNQIFTKLFLATLHVIVTESREMPAVE